MPPRRDPPSKVPKGKIKRVTWVCGLCRTLNKGSRIRCRACNLARKPNAYKRWPGTGKVNTIKGKMKAKMAEKKKA